MDPVVRPAGEEDCADLARLEALARDAIRDVRGGALRLGECPPVDDWPALVRDHSARVFVGTLDDAVVAYMVLVLQPARNRGTVTHVYVEPEARELGLGDTMVEHAISTVRDAGLGGIESVALPGDRETKNLFERAGLTARLIIVYKSLVTDAR